MCPFQLDYLSQSFWSLPGKSVPLSHRVSSIFDLARVDLEVRRPWPDEINGQIGFFPSPWSPWKKSIKQQGDLEEPSQPLSAHWTRLCFHCGGGCDKSVIWIQFNWSNLFTALPPMTSGLLTVLQCMFYEEKVSLPYITKGRDLKTETFL